MITLERFANDGANGLLSAGINSVTTTVVLATGHGARFPSVFPFRVRCDDELMRVDGRSGDSLTVVRAIESTTAASHAINAQVNTVLTKAALERWVNDYVAQPRHHNLVGWAYPPGELGTSSNTTLTANREIMSKVWLPESPGAISKIWWHQRQAAATTAVNVRGTLRDKNGVLVAKTAELVGAGGIPAAVGTANATLVAEAGHTLSELVGGPGEFILLGFFAGTVGNLLIGKRGFSDASNIVNVGLIVGTDVPAHFIQSAADAGGPTATINPLTGVGLENQAVWLGLS